jgi:hypothetical protein
MFSFRHGLALFYTNRNRRGRAATKAVAIRLSDAFDLSQTLGAFILAEDCHSQVVPSSTSASSRALRSQSGRYLLRMQTTHLNGRRKSNDKPSNYIAGSISRQLLETST